MPNKQQNAVSMGVCECVCVCICVCAAAAVCVGGCLVKPATQNGARSPAALCSLCNLPAILHLAMKMFFN